MKAKDIRPGMQVILPKFNKIKNCLFSISRIEGKRVRLVNFTHSTYLTIGEFLMLAKDGRVYPESDTGEWNGKEKFDDSSPSALI